MDSTFYFDGQTSYSGEIEVEDIQNCCIEAIDNLGMNSYLLIKTDLGITSTLEFGPLVPDSSELPDYTSIVFSRYEASEYKTKKDINKFLAPKDKGKRKVVEVNQIEIEEAIASGIDLIKYFYSNN